MWVEVSHKKYTIDKDYPALQREERYLCSVIENNAGISVEVTGIKRMLTGRRSRLYAMFQGRSAVKAGYALCFTVKHVSLWIMFH